MDQVVVLPGRRGWWEGHKGCPRAAHPSHRRRTRQGLHCSVHLQLSAQPSVSATEKCSTVRRQPPRSPKPLLPTQAIRICVNY